MSRRRRPRLVGRDLVRQAHARCRDLRAAGLHVFPMHMLRMMIRGHSRCMQKIFINSMIRFRHEEY